MHTQKPGHQILITNFTVCKYLKMRELLCNSPLLRNFEGYFNTGVCWQKAV